LGLNCAHNSQSGQQKKGFHEDFLRFGVTGEERP
jgi:hypothetical protein